MGELRDDEQGGVLIFAIATLALLAVVVTALLTFAEQGFSTAGTSAEQTEIVYAAEGAVEQWLAVIAAGHPPACPEGAHVDLNDRTFELEDCHVSPPVVLADAAGPVHDVRLTASTEGTEILRVRVLIDAADTTVMRPTTWSFTR